VTQRYAFNIFAVCLVLPMLTFISESCRTNISKSGRINMGQSDSTKSPSATVEEIKQLVAKEAPIGSSKTQVMALLDAHKIQHSDYSEHPERESDFRDARLDGKREFIKGYIRGIVRNAEPKQQQVLSKWDIQIFFYFDDEGALVDSNVKGVGTSF
jgi:hypothetical protein